MSVGRLSHHLANQCRYQNNGENDQSTVKDNTVTTTTTFNSSSIESTQADSEVQAESEQNINGEKSIENGDDSMHVQDGSNVCRKHEKYVTKHGKTDKLNC